ncbi:MAG TPA: hypothetical protein VGJ86_15705 [Acidimicrobiales bacterium]|jgi:hypothetical protein
MTSMLLAMDYPGYVATGWLGAIGLVGVYAFATLRRGRKLSRRVPPGDRRWS